MIIWKNQSTCVGQNKPAIFLDRDGVINVEQSYITSAKDLHIYDYVKNCIDTIHEKGYYAIVISNQSGIARGIIPEQELLLMNEMIGSQTGVDAIYCCPHYEKGIVDTYSKACDCRKPKTGLINQAVKDFGIDLSGSYMVGDRAGDILTGKNAGIRTVLVNTGYGIEGMEFAIVADYYCEDLREVVNLLL